jgi:hypothetical protein
MSDATPRLPDQYLDTAKDLARKHRRPVNCKTCYSRGYLGTSQQNLLVPCSKCVATDELMEDWRKLVRETPELAELYGDYFDAQDEEEEQDEDEKESAV